MTMNHDDKSEAESASEMPVSGQLNIALFCGGRGSATIIHELLRWPHVHLTLIVNAYDDGLSTGALRGLIAQMLGPSDFRKNLSYLLDPYSEEQYALKHLLELRLPDSINEQDIAHIYHCVKNDQFHALHEPLFSLFQQLNRGLLKRLRYFLETFFSYAHATQLAFDYRDCSVGNLIFAGAYLEHGNNFNAATKELSQLVSSRARLVNVSQGENRILVGLKEDGELLTTEAQVVGIQSAVPIKAFFLVEKSIDLAEWASLAGSRLDDRIAWLRAQERLPKMSIEAEEAISNADIILYGPGTQHSSLLPSYRIAENALQRASAPIKAMVMNLGVDHDIQSLSAQNLIDNALLSMGDSQNQHGVITHVLCDKQASIPLDALLEREDYQHARIVWGDFGHHYKEAIHNGAAVVEATFGLWDNLVADAWNEPASMRIFIDIHKRSLALTELYDELLEMDWNESIKQIRLTVNQSAIDGLSPTDSIQIESVDRTEHFPEIDYFFDWLRHEKSEYLIVLTGDGKYCFRDVRLAIKLLEQSHFGAVFGSRNQSRVQFQASLRAAYGEKKLLSQFSFLGSFLISALFALRCGILLSDPLTGFRIFKRSRMTALLEKDKAQHKIHTPIALARYLIRHHVEIAELPVTYRTFAGFVDPHWRIRRGLSNLKSAFSRTAV